MKSLLESERSMYDGLSLDDALVVATIDQRFHALTDAGVDAARALMLAVQVDVPLSLHAHRPAA